MIPCRVKLSGFLSYKDEQEVRFDDSHMWMLAGLNGSGKSSIFDAITFALFGVHRGGSQQITELINKESNALCVELDFRIDGQFYRAKRTARRTKSGGSSGTQQLFQLESVDGNGKDQWAPIPDTNQKREFDLWIREHIGLDFDTFTSSVLLLQGKAEKLLDSKPSGRAEVLAKIVDLERYQRLHQKADERRLHAKAHLEALQGQYDAIPNVTDLEIALTTVQIEEASDQRQRAANHLESVRDLEMRARQWAELNQKIATLKQRLRDAEALLGDADAIERDYQRLCELRNVLPHVNAVLTIRSKKDESQRKEMELRAELEKLEHHCERVERETTQCHASREKLKRGIDDDERQQRELDTRLRELSGILGQVQVYEKQQMELARFEKERSEFPDSPEEDVTRLRGEHDRLSKLVNVLPILQRFARERELLQAAIEREKVASSRSQAVTRQGSAARQTATETKERHRLSIQQRERADEEATTARTLALQAEQAVREFRDLKGERLCRSCGQALTEAHFTEELHRRTEELERATQRRTEANTRRTTAREAESKLASGVEQLDRQLERLREEWISISSDVRSAHEAVQRHAEECRRAYLELPEGLAHQVTPTPTTDWAATTFPTTTRLQELQHEAAALDVIQRDLDRAEATLRRWHDVHTQLKMTQQSLSSLKSSLRGHEPAEARQRERELRAQETSIQDSLQASRRALNECDRDANRLAKDLEQCRVQLNRLREKLSVEQNSQSHCRDEITRLMALLPEAWRSQVEQARLTVQHEWKVELEKLIAVGTEDTFDRLKKSRVGLEPLRHEIAEREDEAVLFPENARRSLDEVRQIVAEARSRCDQSDEQLQRARREFDVLDNHRKRRAAVRDDLLQAERDHALAKSLAQLLGRDRLQRHLVRQAERQIVEFANSVLDRLSAGELCLRLSGQDGGDPGKALELEALNRVTGESPINVAFLSGSQRFRVAVALAVGIGQYASRRHRPIESVIIDEGFGCLDRFGRQGMIEELRNLRGQLQCILLVSHQEEFSDAFADGYHFELEAGSTRIRRFSR